jgi:flagellar hook-associated protein 3 FlgL
MDLRVSLQTIVNNSLFYEQQQTAALSRLQQQASSGNRILAPEDDPLGSVAVINYNTQDAAYDTELANINTATTTLNQGVSTLQDASNVVVSAKSLAIQATNSGNDQNALNAIATQVDALLKRLTDLANTQSGGQYLFGGTRSQSQPFVTDASGNVTYAGAAQRANVPVGPGQTVDTYYAGSAIFQAPQPGGTGTDDAFQTLAALRDDLRNTGGLTQTAQLQAVSGHLAALDRINENILGAVGEQSATLQNLGAFQTQVQDAQLQTKQLTGDIQSADMTSVVTNLQAEQNLFQATLATTSKVLSQSLLDFIK